MSTTDRQQPHVVLFLCDQLRADALGFMGNDIVQTPNLDRLASRGVVFDNMFVQTPVCMGSRACLLTGRYLRTIRMGNGSPLLDPHETTITEILRRSGYRTGMFGKLHLTPQEYTRRDLGSDRPIIDPSPFLGPAGLPPMTDDPLKQNYGFTDAVGFEDILWGEYRDWIKERDPALAARMPTDSAGYGDCWKPLGADDIGSGSLADVGHSTIPPELHPSSFIAESACAFFKEHHSASPCFMHVSFVDPHHPFDPPEEVAASYPAGDMPLPKYNDTGELVWPDRMKQEAYDFSNVTPELTQTTISCYYAMIDMIDRSVGMVLDEIEAAGQMDNTLFIFMADHGEYLGDYGLFRKGSFCYDNLLRVPSFISWPGHVAQGKHVSGLVEEVDLAPTILGLLGMPEEPGMQGRNMATNMNGELSCIGRPWTFTECYQGFWGPFINCWTLRSETAKLNYYPTDRIGHLFDLKNDPDERDSLFDSAAHRDLRDEMMGNLIECVHSQVDPLPRMISQY